MNSVLVLYVPVIHRGYLELLERYRYSAETVSIIGKELIAEFIPIDYEIRALEPEMARDIIERFGWYKEVFVAKYGNDLSNLASKKLIVSGDAICRKAVTQYLPKKQVTFDTAFLRWDELTVYQQLPVNYDRQSRETFDQEKMRLASALSGYSSDWWRRVGAVVVQDGRVILEAFNQHLPTEQAPYLVGDPRDMIKAGKDSHLSTALHAEQAIIATAAREGLALGGSDLYVTTFPCPVCAKLIVEAGFRRLFYCSGHASLDGEVVLKAAGVELVWVKLD